MRRLAASRRADDRRHPVLLDVDRVVEERLLLAVEEVEVAHRDLAGQARRSPRLRARRSSATSRRGGATVAAPWSLRRFVHGRPYHSLPRWKRSRTRMFMPSTTTMMSRAPPQARSCQWGYGDAGEVVDGLREVGDRAAEVAAGSGQPRHPVRAAQGREEQRRGLAGDAHDGEGRAGDQSAARRVADHAERDLPARRADREAGLAQLVRHQVEDVLGGARHHREHDERQRDGPGEAGVVLQRLHEDGEGEHADDDRRHAHHHVGDHADGRGHAAVAAELGEVDAAEEPDRDRHERGHPGDDERADDGVGEAAGGGRDVLRRRLREERDVPDLGASARPPPRRRTPSRRCRARRRSRRSP